MQEVNPDGFHVIDRPSVGAPIRWLDDQRIYISLSDYYSQSQSFRDQFAFTRNVILNVDTGAIEAAKHVPSTRFCYYKGYISYLVGIGDDQVFFEGRWGEEKAVLRRPLVKGGQQIPRDQQTYIDSDGQVWPATTQFFFNKFNCRLERRERIGRFNKYPLHEGHGYILSEFDPERLVYYPDGVPGSLPLSAKSGDFGDAVYSEALGVYFLPVNANSVSSREHLDVWVIRPNTAVHAERVSGGPWFGASRVFRVSRAGPLIWSNNNTTSPGDGFAGLYLVRDAKVVRIVAARASYPEVSPNGCRIAAEVSENQRPNQLRIIDVCKPRLKSPGEGVKP